MIIKRFTHRINRIMASASGVALGFIMIFILVDIISRTISKAIFGAAELAIFAMIIAVYLGLPYCEEKNSHVRVEILSSIVSPKYKKLLDFVSYLFVFGMWGIVVYSVGEYALWAYKSNEAIAAGNVPMIVYPVIFVMFVCCIFYWIEIGLKLLEKIKILFQKN